jgi:hypothetical protein
MKARLFVTACACALLVASAAARAATGTSSSVGWVRSAATRVLQAELSGDGAGACAVLYAPLTATRNGRTCAQRWQARSARLLAESGGAARLRADLRAVRTAPVTIAGPYATITLPHPLLGGSSRFYWTQMCWMLTG